MITHDQAYDALVAYFDNEFHPTGDYQQHVYLRDCVVALYDGSLAAGMNKGAEIALKVIREREATG